MCAVPSQVPDLLVTECGATHMKLQWVSPDEMNGVLKGYNIKYGMDRVCVETKCLYCD